MNGIQMQPPLPTAPSERQVHWQGVYTTKDPTAVSWFQAAPTPSLELIQGLDLSAHAQMVDIGGGTSALAGALLVQGLDITVLDIAPAALAYAQARLGEAAQQVQWVAADILDAEQLAEHLAPGSVEIWHDRAVFHFLHGDERLQYVEAAARAVAPGGYAIIGTFAPDGPERCSGLSVRRYSAEALAEMFAPAFQLVSAQRHEHITPGGSVQAFTFVTLQRTAGPA
ncbi:hypothetical protein GCM10017783_16530 [Deinococcus piscis]|uniref:Methyltransferase type 12 domain-containing protein n=1 Tax=Deinococcus piscis TaxID=394230 RepID=A0ABQ3K6T9_9DEIO|nr:class I SAM-dependent methyltransferase [Deinococcus piscis]GHG04591.1 hypothetical protein GCM10017783_16530 [Deinococcus piscis]